MLVGQPDKVKLEDAAPADVSTLREGLKTFAGILKSGQPPEVPAAMPVALLYQTFLAAVRYVELAEGLVELEAEDNEELLALQEQAQALLDQKPIPLQGTSRIITPN